MYSCFDQENHRVCEDEAPGSLLLKTPSEVLLRVLSNVSPSDVSGCRRTCKTLWNVITGNRTTLARRKCNLSIDFANDRMSIQFVDNNTSIQMELNECNLRKLMETEVSSLSLSGTPSLALFDLLLQAIITYRQTNVTSLLLEKFDLIESTRCSFFFQLILTDVIEQVSLIECNVVAGDNLTQLERLSQLTQFTLRSSNVGTTQENFLDSWVEGRALELRHGLKRYTATYADSMGVSTAALSHFLHNWLMVSDARYFQIVVRECPQEYVQEFLHECEQLGLSQVHLEFPSRANRTAHVKAKYDPAERTFQLFPIIDVPARLPGQYICYARYYRDF